MNRTKPDMGENVLDNLQRSALNYFSANPMDRLVLKRRDEAWIAERLMDPATRIVPMWRTRNLFSHGDVKDAKLLAPSQLDDVALAEPPMLLGELDGEIYFAVRLLDTDEDVPTRFAGLGEFVDLRMGPIDLKSKNGAILAYAKGMAHWHARHNFCGDCGSDVLSRQGGFVLQCTNPECGKSHFPRTDPAVIMLVEHDGACLLARQASWPEHRYSILAGFVEPGESAEDAVVREVQEESNVRVDTVHYHSSQPWPFPASLMLGYIATTTDAEIELIDGELEEARWLTRQQIAEEMKAGTLRLPPEISISRRIIESWFDAGGCGKLNDLKGSW